MIVKYAINKFYEEMKRQGKNYYENYFDGIEYIDIIYKVNKEENKLKLFGEKFVQNNKSNCTIVINGIEYDLVSFINIKDYNYDNSGKFKIKLYGVKNIIDMSYIFHKCPNLIEVPNISQMNTTKVTNMSRLFEGCTLLESLPNISNWDISNVTDIRAMFYNCKNLKNFPDISNWNTSNVITMKEMFWSCSKLNIKKLPDFSKWEKSKATDYEEVLDGYEQGKNKNVIDYLLNGVIKTAHYLYKK